MMILYLNTTIGGNTQHVTTIFIVDIKILTRNDWATSEKRAIGDRRITGFYANRKQPN